MKFNKIEVVLLIHNIYYKKSIDTVKHWMNKYIEELLLPKLGNQGFKVKFLGVRHDLPEQTEQGILVINYNETKGRGYGSSAFSYPMYWGVDISCELRLIHPVTGTVIWQDQFMGVNSSKVSSYKGLHIDALENLEDGFNNIDINLNKWRRNTTYKKLR